MAAALGAVYRRERGRDGTPERIRIDLDGTDDPAHRQQEGMREFLQGLVARRVRGVQLVTSAAHAGPKQAIAEVFVGAVWQRCRVHFRRNVLAHVPKTAQARMAATVRTIFIQDSRATAQAQLAHVCATLADRFLKVVALLAQAEEEVFAFSDFPSEHWRQIDSTNPAGAPE